jgi:hypothetical protein
MVPSADFEVFRKDLILVVVLGLLGFVEFDMHCYRRIYELNERTFVPFPFLLIPISTLVGSCSGPAIGCLSHAFVPYPYFATFLLFLCLCTRKPTYKITLFMFFLHLMWTCALIFHVVSADECLVGYYAMVFNAVVCSVVNLRSIFPGSWHNFAFDSTDLGHKFCRITVVLSRFKDTENAKTDELRNEITAENIEESKLSSLVAIADEILQNAKVDAKWPKFTTLLFRFIESTCLIGIVYLNYTAYFSPSLPLDGQNASSQGLYKGHNLLMTGAGSVAILIWFLPFSRNELASQDFRFLLRALSFASVNLMIAYHCTVQGTIPFFLSLLAYCFDVWGWWIASNYPINMTAIRILSLTVSLVKVVSNGEVSPWISQVCSQVVLTELIDIRTQRLLTKNDKYLICILRFLSLSTLFVDYERRFVDIFISLLLVFPFSYYVQN